MSRSPWRGDCDTYWAWFAVGIVVHDSAKRFVLVAAVAVLILPGCAVKHVMPAARPTALLEVERMVLMPIADSREDSARFESVGVGLHVRKAAHKLLAKKGYALLSRDLFDTSGVSPQPAVRSIEDLSASELAALGPQGVETLLFIFVKEVSQHYDGGGDAYRIVLSALVVDKESETIIWQSSGVGTSNFGGIFKAVAPLRGQYDAAYEALVEVFSSVPNRKA